MSEPKYDITSIEFLNSIRFWNKGEFKKISVSMGFNVESVDGGFIVSLNDHPTLQKFLPITGVLCVDYTEVK